MVKYSNVLSVDEFVEQRGKGFYVFLTGRENDTLLFHCETEEEAIRYINLREGFYIMNHQQMVEKEYLID